MARRKKGKESEPAEVKPDEDAEPTQVDAKIPEPEPETDAEPASEDGAEVESPLAGDTEKLYTDQPPVPPDERVIAPVPSGLVVPEAAMRRSVPALIAI